MKCTMYEIKRRDNSFRMRHFKTKKEAQKQIEKRKAELNEEEKKEIEFEIAKGWYKK